MSPLFLTERGWKPSPFWCRFPSREGIAVSPVLFFFFHPRRLSKSLDRLGPEVFFWQSKISEVLGGSGYNADRLSTPYVPQLTGMCHLVVYWRTRGREAFYTVMGMSSSCATCRSVVFLPFLRGVLLEKCVSWEIPGVATCMESWTDGVIKPTGFGSVLSCAGLGEFG